MEGREGGMNGREEKAREGQRGGSWSSTSASPLVGAICVKGIPCFNGYLPREGDDTPPGEH